MYMPLPEKPRVREQMKGNAMANPLYDGLFGRHAGKTTPFLHLLDGSTITHQDFLSRAAQIANVMLQLNLKPGDRVAYIYIPDSKCVAKACLKACGVVCEGKPNSYLKPSTLL